MVSIPDCSKFNNSLLRLCHDEIEDGSGNDAYYQEERRTGVVVNNDGEDDDTKEEDYNWQDDRHFNGTLTIRLFPAQV